MKEFLSKNKWPLLLAAIAVIVRLVYLIEVSQKLGFSVPMTDEQWHWQGARDIVEKSFWGEGSYPGVPIYKYFLAFLYFITGGSLFWAKLLQILLCGGTAFFLFKTTEQMFGNKSAIIAGLIYSFYGTLVFYETVLGQTALLLFLTVWSINRLTSKLKSDSSRSWIITGVIFGLAAITESKLLLVLPFLVIWLIMKHRKNSTTFWNWIKPSAVFIIGSIWATSPVIVRNLIVGGGFVPITAQSGLNLYLGNNEYADGQSLILPKVEPDNTMILSRLVRLSREIAKNDIGHELSEPEICGYWAEKAFQFIVDNPGKFLKLTLKRKLFFISGVEIGQSIDVYAEANKSKLLTALVWNYFLAFPFGLLLPLALIGAFVLRSHVTRLLPIYIFIVVYSFSVILTLVNAIDRLPIVPLLMMVAAGGLVRLGALREEIPNSKKLILALVFIAFLLPFNQKLFGLGQPHPFFIYYGDGLSNQSHGEFAKAEIAFLRADSAFPFSAQLAVNLAEVEVKLNKTQEAEKNVTRAIELNPQSASGYNVLGLLIREKGELDSALVLFGRAVELFIPSDVRPNEIGEYYLNLAECYRQLEMYDSAGAAYHQAMTRAPLFP